MVKTRLRAEIGGDQRKPPSKDSNPITLGKRWALICTFRGFDAGDKEKAQFILSGGP